MKEAPEMNRRPLGAPVASRLSRDESNPIDVFYRGFRGHVGVEELRWKISSGFMVLVI